MEEEEIFNDIIGPGEIPEDASVEAEETVTEQENE